MRTKRGQKTAVGSKQNIIEINGKRYDTATGRMVDGVRQAKQPSTRLSGSVDGMTTGKPLTPYAGGQAHKKPRTQAHHLSKSNQKSQTLMRKSVKKPVAQTVTSSVKPGNVAGIQKRSLGQSHTRMQSAKQISRSPLVQKYGETKQNSSVQRVASHHTVRQAPHQSTPQQPHNVSSRTHESTRLSAAAKMIENSLAQATAHEHIEQPAAKHTTRRKWLKKLGVSSRAAALSSAVLAGVLLGGFFAVQNVPNLSMRVAAARAGFDARMPGYNPSGFSFNGPINYRSGQVTVSFRSNTDDRRYDVVQRTSNWNSDSLLANYILEENKQYQTYVDRGRTLYIYDGSNATWVDDGVWYVVEGQSAMTTDQLVRLAASI